MNLPLPSDVCTVCTSNSALSGGRATVRTTCAQNFGYIALPTHCAAHLLCASLVNTAARPKPVCQCASTGSLCVPATIGISICGLFFLLVSTSPYTLGNSLTPLIISLADGGSFSGMPLLSSWIKLRRTTVASLIKICGSWLKFPLIGPYARPLRSCAICRIVGGR